MKKRLICVFGAVFLLCLGLVSAEKIQIDVGNNYLPGEEIKFKVILYDDNTVKIPGKIGYRIDENYYIDEPMASGVAESGEELIYVLPEHARQGVWKISAIYGNVSSDIRFSVGELSKASIKLEGDEIIITNVGNTVYKRDILIYIGDYHEIAMVSLEFNQTKKIRLTAPDGTYNINVSDGSPENTLEVTGVSLTGNVIGLESVVGDSFWKQYPILIIFIGLLVGLFIIITLRKSRKTNYVDLTSRKH